MRLKDRKKPAGFSRFLIVVLALVLGFSTLTACSNQGTGSESGFDALPAAGAEHFTSTDGVQGFLTKGWRIDFEETAAGGYKLNICREGSSVPEYQSLPVTLYIKSPAKSLLGGFTETVINEGYGQVKQKPYGYYCAAELTTEKGSEIKVEDAYYLSSGEFTIERMLTVKKTATGDNGVASSFRVTCAVADGYQYFVPSILYKDTQNMPSTAVFSNTGIPSMYVMETRTGLPMAMLYSPVLKSSVAVTHFQPEIASSKPGGGVDGDVDNDFEFGSIGIENGDTSGVGFRYPSAEGPASYNRPQGWVRLYHDLSTSRSTSYSVGIILTDKEKYNDSMEETYRRAFTAESPEVITGVDIDEIVDQNLYMFEDTYKEFGTGSNVSAGVPWSMDLVDKYKNTPYSFQMGFVGQQTSVGAQLLRRGYEDSSQETRRKGETILNFWTSDRVFVGSNALPYVWWDPNASTGGTGRDYATFLRAFVDGCEGILDAYLIAAANGDSRPVWLSRVVKTADFLCANQNTDGSFYRAYNRDGSVNLSTADPCTQGNSKFNTPVAVRFLLRMYETTGQVKYKTAAIRAADYAYDNLYNGLQKYVGGTIDQQNVVDREAAIYALYCFESAYSVTGEGKYLAAAKHAAASALSWVYVYDFSVANNNENAKYNPFREGGVSGFSIIATGHSGADNFASYLYYTFFRMHIHTGDDFYLHAAKLLQNNTKSSSDYKNKHGYAYRAIATEATIVATFNYTSVNAWLPWSSIANIDPAAKMKDTFGVTEVESVTGDSAALKACLSAYGVGGKM